MERTDLEQAVHDYTDMLYSFALSRTCSKQDAEDVLQEVFLIYLRKSPVFENEAQRRVWLMKVAVNCCRGVWRFRRRHRALPLEQADAPALESPEERELLLEVERLPEKYRTAVQMFYFGGLSAEEIGAVLGCTPETVCTRLKRARDTLRARMTD